MILLLDVGNTRIKWGCHDGRDWRGQGAFPTAEHGAVSGLLAEWQPAWVGISCVADKATQASIEGQLAGIPRHWLDAAETGHGIVNRYEQPGALGADRYAAMLACFRLGLTPCVVVSAGTALTVDALSGDGEFLGGMIAPGSGLMRLALDRGTAGVRTAAGQVREFPLTTADAVESGIMAALAGTVEAMRRHLAGRLGCDATLVLTGGDAERLALQLAGPARIERNLILEGLLWLARDLGKSDD